MMSTIYGIVERASVKCLVAVLLLVAVMPARAVDLPGIIAYALKTYPTITQAQIDVQTAKDRTNQAKLAYLPTFTAGATQGLQGGASSATSVTGSLNLYSGGAVEEKIYSTKVNQEFAAHKVDEAGENMANDITTLYMNALTAKLQIAAQNRSFERHQKTVDKLRIIVQYDKGRRSDLTQALARQAQITTQIARLQSEFASNQNQLRKYLAPNADIQWELPSGIDVSMNYADHPSLMASYASERFAESEAELALKNRRPKLEVALQGGADSGAQLRVNWPFFDPVNAAGDNELKSGIRRRQAETVELRQRIDERVYTARNNIMQLEQTLQAARAQVPGAKQVIDDFDLQFSIAKRSMLDVLNAYSELATIETAEAQAMSQKAQAQLALKFATGSLVDWALRN